MGKFKVCLEVNGVKLGSVLEALHPLKLGAFDIQPIHEGSRATHTADRLNAARKNLISPPAKRKEGAELVTEYVASCEPMGATRQEIQSHISMNGFQPGSLYYILSKAERKKMIRFDEKSQRWHTKTEVK